MNKKAKIVCYVAGGLLLTNILVNAYFESKLVVHDVEIVDKSPLLPLAKYDYLTTEDTSYRIDGDIDIIPNEFRTDFASIPKQLWFIDAPYKANLVYPSLWHDYHYVCPGKLSRKEIDDVFYSLLRYEQTGHFKALKMYIAVRLFGSSHFNKDEICEQIIATEREENGQEILEGSRKDFKA